MNKALKVIVFLLIIFLFTFFVYAEEAEEKVDEVGRIEVLPEEVTLYPSQRVTLDVTVYDEDGFLMEAEADWARSDRFIEFTQIDYNSAEILAKELGEGRIRVRVGNEQKMINVRVIEEPDYNRLNIRIEGVGKVKLGEEQYSRDLDSSYDYEEEVILDLEAITIEDNWDFSHWEGDIEYGDIEQSQFLEIEIKMDEDREIIAVFKEFQVFALEMINVRVGTTLANNGGITLGYDIEMGKYPVTFENYLEYANSTSEVTIPNDSGWGMGNRPVINVSWFDALRYCNWLSEQEGLEPAYDLNNWRLRGRPEELEGFRLPTEDEWEYAARGGVDGRATIYAGSSNLEEVGWYWRNSGDRWLSGSWTSDKINNNNSSTRPVGQKEPNELGLYDMSGNVWEWTDTIGWGSNRVHRGGAWYNHAQYCEVDYTISYPPSRKYYDLGFRVVRTRI